VNGIMNVGLNLIWHSYVVNVCQIITIAVKITPLVVATLGISHRVYLGQELNVDKTYILKI
jgi:hypothetical protein